MTALPAASITSSALDDLDALNAQLEGLRADERVAWALQHGPQDAALSSSFGAQSAVTLHLLSQQRPDIPVILIDTGYLFPETYRFADALTERLKLNLKVYRRWSAAPGWKRATAACGNKAWSASISTTTCARSNRCAAPWTNSTWAPGSPACAAANPAAARRRQSCRSAVSATKSAPSPTGPIATCGSTCRRTSCRTTTVGTRLRVHRRFPHHASLGTRHARGRHALLWPEAGVRHPRGYLAAAAHCDARLYRGRVHQNVRRLPGHAASSHDRNVLPSALRHRRAPIILLPHPLAYAASSNDPIPTSARTTGRPAGRSAAQHQQHQQAA